MRPVSVATWSSEGGAAAVHSVGAPTPYAIRDDTGSLVCHAIVALDGAIATARTSEISTGGGGAATVVVVVVVSGTVVVVVVSVGGSGLPAGVRVTEAAVDHGSIAKATALPVDRSEGQRGRRARPDRRRRRDRRPRRDVGEPVGRRHDREHAEGIRDEPHLEKIGLSGSRASLVRGRSALPGTPRPRAGCRGLVFGPLAGHDRGGPESAQETHGRRRLGCTHRAHPHGEVHAVPRCRRCGGNAAARCGHCEGLGEAPQVPLARQARPRAGLAVPRTDLDAVVVGIPRTHARGGRSGDGRTCPRARSPSRPRALSSGDRRRACHPR